MTRKRLKNGIKHHLKSKLVQKDDGKTVKMVQIRRKRKKTASVSEDLANPNGLSGSSQRVALTDELGRVAPIQTKPSAVGAKKTRYRSIQPGLSNLVKKAAVDPLGRGTAAHFIL